ncbi:MAG TPA: dephospho-CoA kinase [Candidatus Nanopelagicaceae bacterium]
MLIVALTGGIGSGKSLVADSFANLGAQVLDADQLSREVIERGSSGFDQVVAAFGDAILRDGEIDRRVLGEIVFANLLMRRKLEAIVHPLVREAFESTVSQLQGRDLLIYEIPLLVETQAASRFDYVITVEAGSQVRRERLMERGMRSSEVEARISAQATSDQRIASADYVIWNDGTVDELLRKVEYLWESVLPLLQREKT